MYGTGGAQPRWNFAVFPGYGFQTLNRLHLLYLTSMHFHRARYNQSLIKPSDVALFFDCCYNTEFERIPVRAIESSEFTGAGAERLRFMPMKGKILLTNQHHTHWIAVSFYCFQIQAYNEIDSAGGR